MIVLIHLDAGLCHVDALQVLVLVIHLIVDLLYHWDLVLTHYYTF